MVKFLLGMFILIWDLLGTFVFLGMFGPCCAVLQCQLHSPDAERSHVGQGAIDPLLTVRLGGLEGHAQTFPHSLVAALSRPQALFYHSLKWAAEWRRCYEMNYQDLKRKQNRKVKGREKERRERN